MISLFVVCCLPDRCDCINKNRGTAWRERTTHTLRIVVGCAACCVSLLDCRIRITEKQNFARNRYVYIVMIRLWHFYHLNNLYVTFCAPKPKIVCLYGIGESCNAQVTNNKPRNLCCILYRHCNDCEYKNIILFHLFEWVGDFLLFLVAAKMPFRFFFWLASTVTNWPLRNNNTRICVMFNNSNVFLRVKKVKI